MKRSPVLFSSEDKGRKSDRVPYLRSPLLRLMTRFAVAVFWCQGEEWRVKRPFFVRTSAHLSLILLAFFSLFFLRAKLFTPRERVSAAASFDAVAQGPPFKAEATVDGRRAISVAPIAPDSGWTGDFDHRSISRLPDGHTIRPERPRSGAIIYVVQPGDTLPAIASRFGLSQEAIVWSNPQAFTDLAWLVRRGSQLAIPPVDGVYHTVRRGETAVTIAAAYRVSSTALYNEWNDLQPGHQPHVGQRLFVPGGQGAALELEPPPRYAFPAWYSAGACGDTQVRGPGGYGWFTYPTGRMEVSGWCFHDRRRPMHIGLDYDCERGDAIYAADSGVVTIAGRYGTYGIMIEINHGNETITRYGHFSQATVACGDAVYQGDLIGYCGNTGWSSGPHLHFEIRIQGEPQDPLDYLPPFDSW